MIRESLTAPKIGMQVAGTLILGYGAAQFWPFAGAAWFHYAVSVLFITVGAWIGGPGLLQIIKYHVQLSRKRKAQEAEATARDAGFETEANLEKAGCFDPNNGVPVGMLNGRPIFFPFTHALVNAPAGTQKTVAAVVPALLHSYRIAGSRKGESRAASVIVLDLKRELRAMTARSRRDLHGQRVIVLDPSDPLSDSYNPLDLVVDCLHGGFPRAKAITFANLLAQILEPEPQNDSKNKFWREGGRNLVVLVMLWLAVFHKERATLPEVTRIIRDPPELDAVIQECARSSELCGELAVMARDVLEQGKYFDEFRTGAALAVRAFSAAGELAAVTSSSTFRWRDAKREGLAIYVCANLSESRAFAPWLRICAECATTELEFSPGNVPVHLCLDEMTNISFDITPKLTALRSAGVRCHMIFQERAEVERVYGRQAMQTIYGEVDCEQYFCINDQHLAQDTERRLGTVEVVKPSYQTGAEPWDDYRQSSNAQRRPLKSAYELMFKMPPGDQILFLRSRRVSLRPIYCQKLPSSAVDEWQRALDDNPIEGGKFPGPSHIHITYSKRGARLRSFKRMNRRIDWARVRRSVRYLPPLWSAWAALWLWLAYAAWIKAANLF